MTNDYIFLPLALEYLRENPNDGVEYTNDLVYFLSANAQDLHRDGLLDDVLTAVRSCFATWTKTFSVAHFDRDACRAKGWKLEHSDYVTNGDVVKELIDDLLRFKAHVGLAEELVLQWIRPERPALAAAWFLEYARAECQGYGYYSAHPTPAHIDMVPTMSDTPIHTAITDRRALEVALSDVAATIVQSTTYTTYWRDLIGQLGLTAA